MADWIISSEALDDLDSIHDFISADNLDAADAVLESAFETFENLANMPGLGRERHFKSSQLSRIRSFCVSGYRNYLIFYREFSKGIEVVRVLHASRDFQTLFDS